MKRTFSRFIAALASLVLLLGVFPIGALASGTASVNGGGDGYLYAEYDEYHRITIDGNIVYCYDEPKASPMPGQNAYKQPVKFTGQAGSNKPSEIDAEIVKQVISAFYAAAPFDGFGFISEYLAPVIASGYNPQYLAEYLPYTLSQVAIWNLLGQLTTDVSTENPSDQYWQAIYNAGLNQQKPQELPVTLAGGDEVFFHEDFQTRRYVSNVLSLRGYDGELSLDLPSGMSVYKVSSDAAGNDILDSDPTDTITTRDRFVLSCTPDAFESYKDSMQSISAVYSYSYPDEVYYYEYVYDSSVNPKTPQKGVQDLIGYSVIQKNVNSALDFTVRDYSGYLEITKIVTGLDTTKDYLFNLKGLDGNSDTDGVYAIRFVNGSGSYQIPVPLAPGRYTLTENTEAAQEDGYNLSSTTHSINGGTVLDGITATFEIKSGATTMVSFTNQYTPEESPTPITYTITYRPNADGDTVTNMPNPNPETGKLDGETYPLSETVPEREGYRFLGWGSEPDAAETIGDVTIPGKNVIVYALWEKEDGETPEPDVTAIPYRVLATYRTINADGSVTTDAAQKLVLQKTGEAGSDILYGEEEANAFMTLNGVKYGFDSADPESILSLTLNDPAPSGGYYLHLFFVRTADGESTEPKPNPNPEPTPTPDPEPNPTPIPEPEPTPEPEPAPSPSLNPAPEVPEDIPVIEIPEEEVPLSSSPTSPEEIIILDEDVPLGQLPQSGETVSSEGNVLWGIGATIMAGLAALLLLFGRKKEKQHSN